MGNFLIIVLILVVIGMLSNRPKSATNQVDTTELLATAVALTNSLKTLRDVLFEAELSDDQRLDIKKALVDIELERDKTLIKLRGAGVGELTIQQVVGVLK